MGLQIILSDYGLKQVHRPSKALVAYCSRSQTYLAYLIYLILIGIKEVAHVSGRPISKPEFFLVPLLFIVLAAPRVWPRVLEYQDMICG